MAKGRLSWDKTGERRYETGVDHVVLFLLSKGKYGDGTAWNGVTAITESPSGGESNPIYADNIKYLNLMSAEELGLTVEAYNYPDEFKNCLGEDELAEGVTIGQQTKKHFGVCFRTKVGNDTEGNDHGYKIHLVFDCVATGSERAYTTINDSPEAMAYSWEISTTPIDVPGKKPSANLVLDALGLKAAGLGNVLKHIEDILYGSANTAPKMPTIEEIQNTWDYGAYLQDSSGKPILDGGGGKIRSMVYE